MSKPESSKPDAGGWSEEIASGQRFGFGANWRGYLTRLDEGRISQAEASLSALLGRERLEGLRLLDMGSGSGLFSLAARRLGACVVSVDYDPDSVACTAALRRAYAQQPGRSGAPESSNSPESSGVSDSPDSSGAADAGIANGADWTVVRGSVLDREFLAGLGRFDVVYSWGVLHHTGDQWAALGNAAALVAPGGLLAVALYNHQPFFTPLHRAMKRAACAGPRPWLLAVSLGYALGCGAALALADLVRGRNPLARHFSGGLPRGMNFWHDIVDWVGGWPFETSTPQQVFEFCRARGFELRRLVTVGGKSGCNEFVFELPQGAAQPAGQGSCASF